MSYDLRYIETSADETVDSNWTVEKTVWTRGSRVYVLDGLTNNTGYDVQVRAVTSSAAAWSATAVGTPADHGDTLAGATDLTPGTRVGASIDSGTDADYFRVVLTSATGLLAFTDGGLDTVGELLDRNGDLIEENDDSHAAHGIRNFLISGSLAAGTYYLKVTSYNEVVGDYVLHIGTIPDGPSFARAISFERPLNGLIDPPEDFDYFIFTLTQQTTVMVSGSGAIHGVIRDPAGTRSPNVGYFDLPAGGFVLLADLAPGTYWIQVSGATKIVEGVYSLYLLEAGEPGSTLVGALPLRPYRAAVATIDPTTDTDYFRIELEDATHVQLWATGADVNITGELLDSGGNTVSSAVVHEMGSRGFVLFHELSAGTHYIKVTRNTTGSSSATGLYAILLSEDFLYSDLGAKCESIPVSNDAISDSLYGCQWHLNNEGQRKGTSDVDINVEDAWTITKGSGINVAVVDDGMQHNHPDLTDNVNRSRNFDYTFSGDIYTPTVSHGTWVAGLIAARDNGIGVRGVAPRATIYGYNYLRKSNLQNLVDAMTRNMADTAVSNSSWSPGHNPFPQRAPELWERAVDSGVTTGFGGKGVFYVFSAGNGGNKGDYGTLNEYVNYYAVTAACAVNDRGRRALYSEMGANLWVCAPSSDITRVARPGIATTNNFGRYTVGFGGTSAAAPQVSGVAALVRAVDSGLNWRDVKLILAASARRNDRDNPGWQTGALKYGSTTDHYEFNHEYGFGVVDANKAVDLAGTWSKLPPMRKAGPVVSSRRVSISTGGSPATSTISVDSDIDFVESVQVDANFDAPDFRDLQVELVSPSGAVSVLSVPESVFCPYNLSVFPALVACDLFGSFRFGSARHLGENASGRWTLRMADRLRGGPSNGLESWSITVYGHKSNPEAPALDHVDPGTNSLTVSWTPPDYPGSSAITGYDVRHIRSDASNKASDTAWTVIEDAGTFTTRRHTIPNLDDGLRRDVQVRAVNASRDGDWSVTARGTPDADNSEPFFVEGETAARTVAETAVAGQAIGSPLSAREADNDTFTFSLGGRDAALFDIDTSSGQLRIKDPLDYETQGSYRVTVSVSDSKDNDGNADTAVDAAIDVTVVVEDVDEPPELIGDTEISYLENGVAEVIEFTATDPEGSTVIWNFSGTDQDDFYFDTGKLEFRSPPNHENPTDRVDPKNEYEVVVTVSDGAQSKDVNVTVTVTDDNEPFKLEGDTAFDYDENSTRQVGLLRVVDDPENGPIDWELSGTDRGDFTLDNGVLSFAEVPDHESPADSDGDNRYHVTVSAFDGDNRESLSVIVTVIDVDEPGEVTLPALQPQVGTALMATLVDPDRGQTGPAWSWDSSASQSGPWDPITGASSLSYTPADTDVGRYLRVTAAYADRHGTGKTVSAVPDRPVRAAPVSNTAPEFPATEDGMRAVNENTAVFRVTGGRFGAPVAAIDADNDMLVYSLGGSHAGLFDIDPGSGQLRTSAELDHESRSSYSVTVTASDPSGASGSIRVVISVANVEEEGTVTFSSEFPQVGQSLTATVADPDGGVRDRDVVWEWHRPTSGFGGWILIDGADSGTYQPTDADLDHHLQARAHYTDRHEPLVQESAEASTVGTVSAPTAPTRPRNGGGGGGGGGGAEPEELEEPESAGFVDVAPRSVHEASIDALYAAGIARGCSREPWQFCPDDAVTRAQMASFLARTLELAAPAQRAGFVDVDRRSVHAANVEALFAAGVTVGCSLEPLRFCPGSAVTRAQMATFLVRALGLAPARPAGFVDVDANGPHAASIDALFAAGVTVGCSLEPLRFCPDSAVTRAQMASFLIRALDSSEESG